MIDTHDPARIRTWNLLLRRQTRYPLRHRTCLILYNIPKRRSKVTGHGIIREKSSRLLMTGVFSSLNLCFFTSDYVKSIIISLTKATRYFKCSEENVKPTSNFFFTAPLKSCSIILNKSFYGRKINSLHCFYLSGDTA